MRDTLSRDRVNIRGEYAMMSGRSCTHVGEAARGWDCKRVYNYLDKPFFVRG